MWKLCSCDVRTHDVLGFSSLQAQGKQETLGFGSVFTPDATSGSVSLGAQRVPREYIIIVCVGSQVTDRFDDMYIVVTQLTC
jgi:hypothetical protein